MVIHDADAVLGSRPLPANWPEQRRGWYRLVAAEVDAGVELGNAYVRQGRRAEAIGAYRRLLTQTKVPVEPSIAAQLKAQIAVIEAAPKDATVAPMRNPRLE